jgi:hypothetical protein
MSFENCFFSPGRDTDLCDLNTNGGSNGTFDSTLVFISDFRSSIDAGSLKESKSRNVSDCLRDFLFFGRDKTPLRLKKGHKNSV